MILMTAALGLVSALSTVSTPPSPVIEQPLLSAFLEPAHPVAPPLPLLGGDGAFGYTYAELNYVYTDLDGVSGSLNGFDATLSWNLLAGLFVVGTYGNNDGNVDIETYKIGAGYHIGLGDKLDILGVLSYAYNTVGGGVPDVDGYELDVGARFMLFEKLEVNGLLEWIDLDDENLGVELGARFYLMNHLSVGATVETVDNDFRFTAGARFQF
jgi:hypothetical protein